jgi:hypothetical protein
VVARLGTESRQSSPWSWQLGVRDMGDVAFREYDGASRVHIYYSVVEESSRLGARLV